MRIWKPQLPPIETDESTYFVRWRRGQPEGQKPTSPPLPPSSVEEREGNNTMSHLVPPKPPVTRGAPTSEPIMGFSQPKETDRNLVLSTSIGVLIGFILDWFLS